jgi:hypothetical protein
VLKEVRIMGFKEFMDGFEFKEGNVKSQVIGGMGGGVAGGTTGAAIGGLVGSLFGPAGTAVGAFIGAKIGIVLGLRSGIQNPKGKVTQAVVGTAVGLAPPEALSSVKPPSSD